MRLTKIVQAILLSGSILALSACTHKTTGTGTMSDGSGVAGAQAYGAGQASGFGDQANMSPEQLLQRRTYYFDYDRSDVREQEKPAIFANADYLVAHPSAHVRVEGNTDPRGSREYNVALGERRANAVAELLRSRGVSGNQIRVVSYGAEKLATPERTEQAYQMDRRVTLVYTQK